MYKIRKLLSKRVPSRDLCLSDLCNDMATAMMEARGYVGPSKRALRRLATDSKLAALHRDLKAMYLRVVFNECPKQVGLGYTSTKIFSIAQRHNIEISPGRKREIVAAMGEDSDRDREEADAWLESTLATGTSSALIASPERARAMREKLHHDNGRDMLLLFAVWHHTSSSMPRIASLFSITTEQVASDIQTVVGLKLFQPVPHKWHRLLEYVASKQGQQGKQSAPLSPESLIPDQPAFRTIPDPAYVSEPLGTGRSANAIGVAFPSTLALPARESGKSFSGSLSRKQNLARRAKGSPVSRPKGVVRLRDTGPRQKSKIAQSLGVKRVQPASSIGMFSRSVLVTSESPFLSPEQTNYTPWGSRPPLTEAREDVRQMSRREFEEKYLQKCHEAESLVKQTVTVDKNAQQPRNRHFETERRSIRIHGTGKGSKPLGPDGSRPDAISALPNTFFPGQTSHSADGSLPVPIDILKTTETSQTNAPLSGLQQSEGPVETRSLSPTRKRRARAKRKRLREAGSGLAVTESATAPSQGKQSEPMAQVSSSEKKDSVLQSALQEVAASEQPRPITIVRMAQTEDASTSSSLDPQFPDGAPSSGRVRPRSQLFSGGGGTATTVATQYGSRYRRKKAMRRMKWELRKREARLGITLEESPAPLDVDERHRLRNFSKLQHHPHYQPLFKVAGLLKDDKQPPTSPD